MLKQLVAFGKSYEKLGIVGKLAVGVGIALILVTFGDCNNHDKLVQFQIKYEQLQKEAESTKKYADSIKTKIAILTNEAKNKDTVITRLTVSIQSQKAKQQKLSGNLEILEENLKNARDTAEIVEVQKGIIYNLNEQVKTSDEIIMKQTEVITNQQYKILKLDEALVLANARGDRLQESIDKFTTLKMPTPKQPLIGKKTAGVIAFIGGVYVGNKVLR